MGRMSEDEEDVEWDDEGDGWWRRKDLVGGGAGGV